MTRIAEKTAACQIGKSGEVHVERVTKLAADALENANYQKNSKKAGKRKEEKSPLLDCLRKEDVSERKEFAVHKRVCGNCADVCPNRANVLIEVPEMELLQIIHVDLCAMNVETVVRSVSMQELHIKISLHCLQMKKI